MEVWLLILLLALTSTTIIYAQVDSCSVEGQLRLTQSTSVNLRNAGRVEICIGGYWGTIAADSVTIPWSEKNAQVACIELGFSGALNSILQRTIPVSERSGFTRITNVICSGLERNITDCSHSISNTTTTPLGNDVFIVCRPGIRDVFYSEIHTGGPQGGDIRLFGDVADGRGAVSIYSTTLAVGWQGICPDSSWTNSDANTICQDLGYQGGAIAAPLHASVGPGGLSLPRLLYNTSCPSSSSDLISAGVCSFSLQQSPSDCTAPEGTFAALSCNTSTVDGSVRLIGGDHSREGVVEIAYDGRWGMVCNGDFSATDARSICQGLGYGRDDARTMSFNIIDLLEIESNVKPIWLNDLSCSSSDRSLPACVDEDNVIGFVQCRFDNIAGVDCGIVSSSSSTIGIVLGVLAIVFIIILLSYVFGQDCCRNRHTYSWYNTLTTPSSWCDCDCFSGSSSSRSSHHGASSNSARSQATPTMTFNLTRREEPQAREAEPEPTGPEPDDPGLTNAPPPSYQDASNFPTHDLQPDLPPPYPGPAYPPPSAPPSALPSAPPSAPPAPNNESYPPAWNEAAYPPPVPLPDSSMASELPYPVDNAPYPS